MQKNLIPLTASLLFFLSCSLLNDQDEIVERPSAVVSQSVTTKSSSSVSFLTRASWGNSCGSFSRAEVNRVDTVVYIKIYGKEPKGATCLTVMITFEAPVTVSIPSTRTYTFKFWQSDSSSKDTTFAVP